MSFSFFKFNFIQTVTKIKMSRLVRNLSLTFITLGLVVALCTSLIQYNSEKDMMKELKYEAICFGARLLSHIVIEINEM